MKFHRDLLQGKNKAGNPNEYFSIKFLANDGIIRFTPSNTTSGLELEYNILGDNKWMEWKMSSNKFILDKKKNGTFVIGDIVMIRAKKGADYSGAFNGPIGTMDVTVDYAVFGNLMTIIKDGYNIFGLGLNTTTTLERLFKGQTKLKEIGNDGEGINCLPSSRLISRCYYEMFSGCTNLINTPPLTINFSSTDSCYKMFFGCTNLVNVSNININNTYNNSNAYMFCNCTNLVDATNININSAIRSSCCEYMFYNCKKLQIAPKINSPICGYRSCHKMFSGCTSLTDVSHVTIGDMDNTNSSSYACSYMFENCTALTTPPTIATMHTSIFCFQNMFTGCTALKTAPALPAETLAPYCYQFMFNGIINENRNIVDACTQIESAGKIGSDNGVKIGEGSCDCMFAGCTNLKIAPEMKIIEIDKDGCYEMFKNTLLNTNNKTIQILATNENSYCGMFYNCGAGSTFISPIDELHGNLSTNSKGCYSHMFYKSTIKTAPKLYLQKASEECCKFMFAQCNKLIDAKNIIIEDTALNVCYGMFYNTILSTNLPILCASTVKEGAYKYMFTYCNELTTLPSSVSYTDKNNIKKTTTFLPATTLADSCYAYMFGGDRGELMLQTNYEYLSSYGCGLKTLPNNLLPATTLADSCYAYMFADTDIVSIPDGVNNTSFLSASKLKPYCYSHMFYKCTSLKSTTKHLIEHITPSNMADSCYAYMFAGCTSLKYNDDTLGYSIPTLNTTNATLPNYCYSYMFCDCSNFNPSHNNEYLNENNRSTYLPQYTLLGEGCYERMFDNTNIKHYPILPATSLKHGCYGGMFAHCSFDDTTIPYDLLSSAKTLATSCYASMFANSNIASILGLPATTLATSCYAYMFSGCKSLTVLPVLPATTLASSCYDSMFSKSGINYILKDALPAKTLAQSCYRNMFNSCISLKSVDELPATTLANYCYYGMFESCTSLTHTPSLTHITDFASYCFYNMFRKCTSLNTITDLPMHLRDGKLNSPGDYSFYGMFQGCASLHSVPQYETMPDSSYCYALMFFDCTALVDAHEITIGHPHGIPGELLATHCYEYMFYKCPLILGLPNMDSDNGYNVYDDSFSSMFEECGFDSAPKFKISNSGYNCYGGCKKMFKNCQSLTDASDIEIANHCGDNIYNYESYAACDYMFQGCVSLEVPPIISAEKLSPYCFKHMFSGCTSLTNAPELPATTLASSCYRYMFSGCKALTTAPEELPATTLVDGCYQYMFSGCSSLTTAPKLPATTLKNSCYQYMFNGCTSLTTAPELPAETLADGCYRYMFQGCNNLKNVKAMFTTTPSSGYTYYWLPTGSGTRTFIGNKNATWLTNLINGASGNVGRSNTTIPNGWTIKQE